MKIIYKTGNLITADEGIIAHGCNAQGKMNSGVAKAIRENYPSAYDNYMWEHETKGLVLGKYIPIRDICREDKKSRIVLNCITQNNYGYDEKRYFSYDALAKVIETISNAGLDEGIPIAFPKIGAGLGGGDWYIIEKIIETYSLTFQPVVYTL